MASTDAQTPVRYPGDSDEAHPEVFTVPPPQPKEKKPGQLPESVIKQYFEEVWRRVFIL